MQIEKNTPYELTASTDSTNLDLNTLMQIDGVERVSPVLNIHATLSVNKCNLDCEIRAVYSCYLNLQFTHGTMYPDSSNMPNLILNEAATKALFREGQTVTVSPEDTVMMNTNGTQRKAVICGIFDDGSEMPVVYMSYDTAQKGYAVSGQKNLIFLLHNSGSAENVVSALQRQNIAASFNPNLTYAWELLQKQCWQTGLLSIALLVCAGVLILDKRSAELVRCRSERAMLLLSGITASQESMIYPIRMLLAQLCCLSLAATAAIIFQQFSLMGFYFSICSVIIVTLVGVIPTESK